MTDTDEHRPEPGRKPWYLRIHWGIWASTLGFLVLLSVIWALTRTLTATGTAPAAQDTGSATAAPALTATVPSVVGLRGDRAEQSLSQAGLAVKWTQQVITAADWTVDAQNPAPGTRVHPGDLVTLTVSKAESSGSASPTTTAPAQATGSGLTAVQAQDACDKHAASAFKYGVRLQWVSGRLIEKIDGDSWYLKVLATVTNKDGSTQTGVNVECTVTGSPKAPVVDVFDAF